MKAWNVVLWIRRVGLFSLAIFAVGCASVGMGAPRTDSGTPYPTSKVGDTYLGGTLVLEKKLPPDPKTGKRTFIVQNVSDQDVKDQTVTVWFYLPSQVKIRPWEYEAKDKQYYFLKHSRTAVTATPTDPKDVRSAELRIDPQRTAAGSKIGSTFLDGALRCEKIDADLLGDHPRITFHLKNISEAVVRPPDYNLVFRRHGDTHVAASSGWHTVKGQIKPGDTLALTIDVGNLKPVLIGLDYTLEMRAFKL